MSKRTILLALPSVPLALFILFVLYTYIFFGWEHDLDRFLAAVAAFFILSAPPVMSYVVE